MHKARVLSAVCLCFVILSCSAPPPQEVPTPAVITQQTASYPKDLQDAQLYRVSSLDSDLHILVYRSGTLAHLGHNHVVSSKSIEGFAWVHNDLSKSGFDLLLPVNELIVDDPNTRATEGEDFSTVIDDQGRAGTKHNMLLQTGLDGDHYPYIRLHSEQISASADQLLFQVTITIKQQTRTLEVPVTITKNSDSFSASGQFSIRQTDFGMTPMSVMAGALRVQDQLTIRFNLVLNKTR